VQQQSGRVLDLLLPLLGQATGETLYLVLETIRAVLGLDQQLLTPALCPPLVDAVYAVWETQTSGESMTSPR
jgi:hypothetical protein